MAQPREDYAIVVDDKTKPRAWGVEAMKRIGFAEDKIITSYYGDHALREYMTLYEQRKNVGFILSDYHMDVRRKPPQDFMGRFKHATLFSGTDLAKAIFRVNPQQRFCLVSAGLDPQMKQESEDAGIKLTLYKRRPEDPKFAVYVDALHKFLNGETELSNHAEFLLPARYGNPTHMPEIDPPEHGKT